ncbi:MAG TPA: tryptophan synthase subunit alpha [Armatimonadota bacterium]|nr:tryptophan synthase subunit alpha [Armatimonadota bacterium]
MSRIGACFEKLRGEEEGALIVFTVAGHPDPETSAEVLKAIADGGADIIELGIPFSDPLADGPAIQAASQRALAENVTPGGVLEMAAAFRKAREVPLVLMTCYNPICQFGLDRFVEESAAAGVDGVIVTDLPPEESAEWVEVARAHGLDTVFLLAPNSPVARVKKVVALASGFVYCVSRMGVTGARADLPSDLTHLASRIRRETAMPVAVGFGISRPEHVAEVCRVAHGAVVGSALVSLIDRHQGAAGLTEAVSAFVNELKAATREQRVTEFDLR